MKILKSEKKLCLLCMENHAVETVEVNDREIFKEEDVCFKAQYEYCDKSDDFLEKEEMIKMNSLSMKDAYREKLCLFTSSEIIKVRKKYNISQKVFSEVLGWGRATITRYENHQVQDKAYDDVLRKINSDPKWFIEKLYNAKEKGHISEKAFLKSLHAANHEFQKMRNQYLLDSIKTKYASKQEKNICNREVDLQKIIEMINYFSKNEKDLTKLKLMNMFCYADTLHMKNNGKTIGGLIYNILSVGAVPEGFEEIVLLDGVHFDLFRYHDAIGYKFKPAPEFKIKKLTGDEVETLDVTVATIGKMNMAEMEEEMLKKMAR